MMSTCEERMTPELSGASTLWAHIYRYKFALQYIRNKDVIDIACGEGYGAAAMKGGGARRVLGVDISSETCEHARRKYGIETLTADAQRLPLPDETFDVVVSFETIEHLPNPHQFLQECNRILRPNGTIVVSTPNKDIYSMILNGASNPFHCSELSLDDFLQLMHRFFNKPMLYWQCPRQYTIWSPRRYARTAGWWDHIPGFWRLVKSRNPLYNRNREARARNNPVADILRPDMFLDHLLNPYVVTKPYTFIASDPTYLLCVAHKSNAGT